MKTLIIGVDVATVDAKLGLAMAEYDGLKTNLLNATLCAPKKPASITMAEWIHGKKSRILLSIDAPLGWPIDMGATLKEHSAGEPVLITPNTLFRRETDRHVHRVLKKTPLDVGADRIARTAHAALSLLGGIRDKLDMPIPLAWSPKFRGVAAIEVYPAATLKSLKIRSSGYKTKDQKSERAEILNSLSDILLVGNFGHLLRSKPDVLDALICIVAGIHFLSGSAKAPENLNLAKREGWIWVNHGE